MATAVSPNIDPHVASFITERRKMLINGKWVEAASGKTFPTYNPATGEVLANVAEGDKADIDAAVEGTVQAAFGFQGQKCSACSRLILNEKIYDQFIQKLKPKVEALERRPKPEDRNAPGAKGGKSDAKATAEAAAFERRALAFFRTSDFGLRTSDFSVNIHQTPQTPGRTRMLVPDDVGRGMIWRWKRRA